MRLQIPLPWYSKAVYDITMDEIRGGWRWLAFEASIGRRAHAYFGLRYGITINLAVGIVTKFPPMKVPLGT